MIVLPQRVAFSHRLHVPACNCHLRLVSGEEANCFRWPFRPIKLKKVKKNDSNVTRRHVQQGLGKNYAQQSVVTEEGSKLKTCWSDSPSTSVILKLRYAYHRWHQSGSVLDFFFISNININLHGPSFCQH